MRKMIPSLSPPLFNVAAHVGHGVTVLWLALSKLVTLKRGVRGCRRNIEERGTEVQTFLRVLSEGAIIVTQTCVCALLLTLCVCTYKHSCRSYFDFFYWARYYFLLLSPRSSPSVESLERQVTKRKRMQKERIKAAMKTPVPLPDSQNSTRRREWSEQAFVAFQ